jgi:hypothetical protein
MARFMKLSRMWINPDRIEFIVSGAPGECQVQFFSGAKEFFSGEDAKELIEYAEGKAKEPPASAG